MKNKENIFFYNILNHISRRHLQSMTLINWLFSELQFVVVKYLFEKAANAKKGTIITKILSFIVYMTSSQFMIGKKQKNLKQCKKTKSKRSNTKKKAKTWNRKEHRRRRSNLFGNNQVEVVTKLCKIWTATAGLLFAIFKARVTSL